MFRKWSIRSIERSRRNAIPPVHLISDLAKSWPSVPKDNACAICSAYNVREKVWSKSQTEYQVFNGSPYSHGRVGLRVRLSIQSRVKNVTLIFSLWDQFYARKMMATGTFTIILSACMNIAPIKTQKKKSDIFKPSEHRYVVSVRTRTKIAKIWL